LKADFEGGYDFSCMNKLFAYLVRGALSTAMLVSINLEAPHVLSKKNESPANMASLISWPMPVESPKRENAATGLHESFLPAPFNGEPVISPEEKPTSTSTADSSLSPVIGVLH
jgi:hypothetical protein